MKQYTNDEVVAAVEGDSHDGIYVYRGTRKLGFITDLRAELKRDAGKKAKQKQYSRQRAADLQQESLRLQDDLEGFFRDVDDIEVIFNISQPNIRVKDKCTIYCMAGIKDVNRISITTLNHDSDELVVLFAGYNLSSTTSNKSIVINNISHHEIVEIAKECKRLL